MRAIYLIEDEGRLGRDDTVCSKDNELDSTFSDWHEPCKVIIVI